MPKSSAQSEPALWPYEEARKLAARVRGYPPEHAVVFESGFGPSGLPHLGTMCEVLRPFYVQHALKLLEPTHAARLIVFIDDMDGLRKVPENIPGPERFTAHIGKPVFRIPDPYGGCHESFAGHMISLLGEFLRPVDVDYELIRSSAMYESGRFDDTLKLILAHHAKIIAIVAPTLRAENRAGWSPFLPLCPQCAQVNATRVIAYHPERGSLEFVCERDAHGCGWRGERSVLSGGAKLQWKVDWAARWHVLAVDYELYGKDLIDSARLSGEILKTVLGGRPPLGFPFEMFLDEQGHKVSKSVGRGVSVDQWLRYAPIEVLKYFLILNPRRARKLFLEAIPQYVDEYLDALREYPALADRRRDSPLEFVLQSDSPRRFNSTVSFAMVMNLVPALGTADRELIWKYLTRYDPGIAADAETRALAERLVECALNYYNDFVAPGKITHAPTADERAQLAALLDFLHANPDAAGEEIEKLIYEIGREHYDKPGKIFPLMYRVILGQERGPRLGAFISLATPARVAERIEASLARA